MKLYDDHSGDARPSNLIGHVHHLLLRGVQPQHQQSLNQFIVMIELMTNWYQYDDTHKAWIWIMNGIIGIISMIISILDFII